MNSRITKSHWIASSQLVTLFLQILHDGNLIVDRANNIYTDATLSCLSVVVYKVDS